MKRVKPELTRVQAWGWQDLMVIAAFRYCLGRRTYIVGACCDWLVDIWSLLEEKTQFVIQRDLDREFELDDAARERGEDYHPLGNDCDRQDWERVRALWREKAKE
jgi:hypothetical protein